MVHIPYLKTTGIRKQDRYGGLDNNWLIGFDDLKRCSSMNEADWGGGEGRSS